MQILNPNLLKRFREPGACAWCGRWCQHRHPHHYFFRRGMGGGSQMDHPLNLASLCAVCHEDCHWGRVTKWDLLAVVAAREGLQQADVEEKLYALRRAR